ncbi:serine/threonine protein kinase [Klebsormidium nitens]|uniref:Serine/threonine protein kinase n=1 Tax=Klebsormidium nitens TaxID=105231 RepID=A0A1Y1IQA2_KLENI|nr:serine/threonine protein kinase [Klebsormidium nitens]|eukprot:GAQ91421.1 serine/threonine protein kinase [Klebsormidium nitens]
MTSPLQTVTPSSSDSDASVLSVGKVVGGEGWKQSAGRGRAGSGLTASKERAGRPLEVLAPELREQYEDTGAVLGKGTYGVIRLLKDKRSGTHVAARFIPLRLWSRQNEKEIILMAQLQHPCMVRFQKAVLTSADLVVITEAYGMGNTLMRFVDKKMLTESQARYLFQQLVAATELCHEVGASGRDLNMETVILGKANPPGLKMLPLGNTRTALMRGSEQAVLPSSIYAAPEILQTRGPGAEGAVEQHDRAELANGKQADVWSLGVILAALVFHTYPFADKGPEKNVQRMFERITAGEYQIPANVQVDDSLRDLLDRIFQIDPNKRITLQQIKEHEWVKVNMPPKLRRRYQPVLAEGVQSFTDVLMVLKSARAASNNS